MVTDFERLHKVVTGELIGRGCGKTFASCHELLNTLFLDNVKDIVCIIKTRRDLTYIFPMFMDIARESEISKLIERKFGEKNFRTKNGKRVRWVSEEELKNYPSILAGLDYILIDFIDY